MTETLTPKTRIKLTGRNYSVPAGTIGTVTDVYEGGAMRVQWDGDQPGTTHYPINSVPVWQSDVTTDLTANPPKDVWDELVLATVGLGEAAHELSDAWKVTA